MKKDREHISKVLSEMFDNPDDLGIYPTSVAYKRLEKYIENERHLALGWMYAEACGNLDDGKDLRKVDVPTILSKAFRYLDFVSEK